MKEQIIDVLRPLGLTERYRGYPILIEAVNQTITNGKSKFPLVQNLYSSIAEEYGFPVHCVERNIRTLAHRAWKVNPGYLQELAGYPLKGPPTVSEFIDILASHVLRQRLVGYDVK